MFTKAAILAIKYYQKSFYRKTALPCLFEPSCSQYSLIAFNKYGFLIGMIKTMRRLMKCKPPNGGIDLP